MSALHATALREHAARRRTFAVISHPDPGKTGRRGVTSDWMAMERQRGISVTSAALQFAYRGTVLNLLDTPGHADFSEDTYRVLAAVDCAVMLLDVTYPGEAEHEVVHLRDLHIEPCRVLQRLRQAQGHRRVHPLRARRRGQCHAQSQLVHPVELKEKL